MACTNIHIIKKTKNFSDILAKNEQIMTSVLFVNSKEHIQHSFYGEISKSSYKYPIHTIYAPLLSAIGVVLDIRKRGKSALCE